MKDTTPSGKAAPLIPASDIVSRWEGNEAINKAIADVSLMLTARMQWLTRQTQLVHRQLGSPEVKEPFSGYRPLAIESVRLSVCILHDWELSATGRNRTAQILADALFGGDHPPLDWWATMTGADMAYAMGYTHAEVPLASAAAVLQASRSGVHWLRANGRLELTRESLLEYVRGSSEWQQKARALETR